MCLSLHPQNEIGSFPQSSAGQSNAVILFWKTQSTGEYVVTRVVAISPDGGRKNLEYFSLFFNDQQLSRLGRDPFAISDNGLPDLAMARFFDKDDNEIDVMPQQINTSVAGANVGALPSEMRGSHPYSDANLRALRDFCRRTAQSGRIPPTFATWWISRGTAPAAFEVVLRAEARTEPTTKTIQATIIELNRDVKANLPDSPRDDATAESDRERIIRNGAELNQKVETAILLSSSESQDEWRAKMAECSALCKQVALEVDQYRARLRDANDAHRRELLRRSVADYEDLAKSLTQLLHPNLGLAQVADNHGLGQLNPEAMGDFGRAGGIDQVFA